MQKPFSFVVEDQDFRKASSSQLTNSCVMVAQRPEGVAIRNSKDPNRMTLFYTHTEWEAFTEGVRQGEFDR